MRNVIIFDNGGETYDRYTIINKATGDMLGSSNEPFHPQGFGQHAGNLVDTAMFHKYGAAWRRHCNVKACIKEEVRIYIHEARNNPKWIGTEIKYKDLPKDVQQFTKQSFE